MRIPWGAVCSETSVPGLRTQRFGTQGVYIPPQTTHHSSPTISQQQTWLIAIGLIAVDLLFPVIPIIPFLAAYVLLARPDWFKDFVDDVYSRS